MILIAQHLWELIVFLIILVGPIPLCLSLAEGNLKENINSSFPHFLLVVMTGWSTVQLCMGLILGSIDRLNLPTVIIAQLGIFISGILAIYITKNRVDRTNLQIPQLKQPLNKWELLIVSAATFAGCVLLGTLATKPTTNYDSLWFHLPAIARWYQTGSFTLLDPSGNWMFEHEQARIYPYNWHVLSVLFVIPFREDFLAAFPLLIAWVLQGLAVYLVSVKLGANRFYSMAASSLVLTVPMLLNQVNTIHPDLPLAAIFTVSLYFGISYYNNRAASELALFLATAGILAGIKITGIAYTIALLAGLAILEIARFAVNKKLASSKTAEKPKNVLDDLRAVNFGNPQQKNRSSKFKLFTFSKLILLCGIACLLFFGGFWYARNLMQINYPVSDAPGVQVPLQPVPLPPSATPQPAPQPAPPVGKSVPISSPYLKIWHSTLAAQFNPFSIQHWQTLGLQIIVRLQLPFIAIALQLLAATLAWIKSRNRAIGEGSILLIALLAGTGILYLITPYSSGTEGNWSGVISPLLGFNLRYGFPFLSLLGIAAAVAATMVKTRHHIVVAAVMLSSFLGIVSSTIFDIIRDSSFTGNTIVWGSLLIDTFKSNPGEAFNLLNKTLAGRVLEVALYPVVFLGLTLLVVWILSQTIPELNWSIARSRKVRNLSGAIAIFTCIVLISSASFLAREKRDIARTELYQGIYEYIDKNAAPDERIGFFFSSRSYLFYGKNLNREVLYVPFKSDVLADWMANLRQNKVGMVAIGPLTKTDEQTVKNLSWMASSQGPLQPFFGKEFSTEPVLYRLK